LRKSRRIGLFSASDRRKACASSVSHWMFFSMMFTLLLITYHDYIRDTDHAVRLAR
jgi:hypothetical protein